MCVESSAAYKPEITDDLPLTKKQAPVPEPVFESFSIPTPKPHTTYEDSL